MASQNGNQLSNSIKDVLHKAIHSGHNLSMKILNLLTSANLNPVIIAVVLLGCATVNASEWDGSLEGLLRSQPESFGTVMDDPDKYRVQIVYTQIDRDENNRPDFKTFTYRIDSSDYFYPASTVKLPTVALALAKLNRLDVAGLDRNTSMLTGSATDYQTAAKVDQTSPDGLPSVGNYARKILLVSDNDAFNRLYEFVGQQAINETLHGMGYNNTRIVHRLEVSLSKDQNRWTNPVDFVSGDKLVYHQDDQRSNINYYGDKPELLGVAEMVNGKRLNRAKDFSDKNAYPLMDQHNVIKSLMFPDEVPEAQRFNLTEDDYRFMHKYMSMYPGESDIATYQDASEYPPGYVKFLMYGGNTNSIPDNIRIFNKVGDAYGFLTDSAYIVDFKNNIEFILSATIFTNDNLTFNDDNYEYDEIGLPFLENLGQSIYAIELKRERPFKPALAELNLFAQ